MADEVAQLITRLASLTHASAGTQMGAVRVLIGEILPEHSAVKEMLAGRRRRFAKALVDRLGSDGWVRVPRGVHRFRRQTTEGELTSDP